MSIESLSLIKKTNFHIAFSEERTELGVCRGEWDLRAQSGLGFPN